MLFSICKKKHEATRIITYELWEHQDYMGYPHSYSIKKRNTMNNDIVSVIAKAVRSKQAIDLIWADVVAGEQK